jgi:hypothetical protein
MPLSVHATAANAGTGSAFPCKVNTDLKSFINLDLEGAIKMKRIVLGVFLSAILGAAQAGTLEVINPSSILFNNYDGQPASITGAENSGLFGYLSATSAGQFIATYLGNESGYVNSFLFGIGGTLLESNSLGKTISMSVGPGTVGFSFSDNQGTGSAHTFSNGQSQTPILGFAIMKGQTNNYGTFDYILGFNDSYTGDADYDDFVVGVKFVSAVPEPQTYAMLLVGLGLIGFTARRRKELDV